MKEEGGRKKREEKKHKAQNNAALGCQAPYFSKTNMCEELGEVTVVPSKPQITRHQHKEEEKK